MKYKDLLPVKPLALPPVAAWIPALSSTFFFLLTVLVTAVEFDSLLLPDDEFPPLLPVVFPFGGGCVLLWLGLEGAVLELFWVLLLLLLVSAAGVVSSVTPLSLTDFSAQLVLLSPSLLLLAVELARAFARSVLRNLARRFWNHTWLQKRWRN